MAEETFAKRTIKNIMSAFGIEKTKTEAESVEAIEKVEPIAGMYSAYELSRQPGVSQEATAKAEAATAVNEALYTTANNVKAKTISNKQMLQVSHEFELASILIPGAIVSPNDLQTDSIAVVSESRAATQDENSKISDMLTEHFNSKDLSYAQKLTKWTKETLFDHGSKSVLIIPQAKSRELNELATFWNGAAVAMESFGVLNGTNVNAAETEMNELVTATMWDTDLDVALEGLGIKPDSKKSSKGDSDKAPEVTLVEDLSKATFEFLKVKADKIKFSDDISAVQAGVSSRKQAMSAAVKAALTKIGSLNMHGKGVNDRGERLNDLIYHMDDKLAPSDSDIPIALELPPESVIPVCAPGSCTDHLGYIILFGDDGFPLRVSGKTLNDELSSAQIANAINKATYGNALQKMNVTSEEQRVNATTAVFSAAMRQIIGRQLEKKGMGKLSVGIHNALGKSIFYNLLRESEIRFVFVPEPLMCYYCVDYRADGTGESLMEHAEFWLSLRTSLDTAAGISALENSTKHRKISVKFDDKETNPRARIERIVNQAIQKYSPCLSTNPNEVIRNISSTHISVKTDGIPGIDNGTDVDYEENARSSNISPDTSFMERLDTRCALAAGLTPSIVNATSETEYAKSVVTNNILLNNRIRTWQRELEPTNNKFARLYVANCGFLRSKIMEILTPEKDSTGNVPAATGTVDTNTTVDTDTKLADVIAHLRINLPTPNVAVTKAHAEEISTYIRIVGELVDALIQDDQVTNKEVKDASLTSAIKATIKAECIREFITKLGMHEVARVDINDNELAKTLVAVNERYREIHAQMTAMNQLAPTPKEGEDASNYSY